MFKKISLVIFSNLIFFLYLLHYFVPLDDFTLSLTINLIIFVLPGSGWIKVFFRKGVSDKVAVIFWIIFLSTVISIAGILIHLAFCVNITSLSQFIYLIVITNIGILISKFSFSDKKELGFIKTFRNCFMVGFIFLAVYAGAYISSTYITPPLEDHDFERQATAYGLIKHLKPYLLTDRKTIFHFAHPPLMHFYSASTILFSDKLSRMKYYYDITLEGDKLLRREFQAGEAFCLLDSSGIDTCAKIIGVQNGCLRFDAQLLAKVEIDYNRFMPVNNDILDVDTFRKAGLWRLIKKEYGYFRNRPYLLETRMPNFLFSALTALVFFYLVFHLTKSRGLSFLGTCVFFTLPQVFILSSGGLYIALTNFSLICLAYGYIVFRTIGIFNKSLTLFFIGLLSAWSNHVAIILPIAIIIREFLLQLRNLKIKVFFSNPAVVGFISGTILFWIYGITIEAKTFFFDHIRYHLWDRIFHINSLGYGGYPSIAGLWKRFAYELGYPLFFLCVASSLFSLRQIKKIDARETVLSFWFLIGAIIFSLVDWRDSAHLVFIIPALVMAPCIFISRQKFNIKFLVIFILLCAVFRNIWLILRISDNFKLIEPAAGW